MNNVPLRLINEDGTEMDNMPVNPLKEKWDKLYPPTRNGRPCSPILGYDGDGSPIMNYICVWCGETKCPHSDYWKVPEEDKEVYEKYKQETSEYLRLHNPSLFKKVDTLVEFYKEANE